MKSLGFWLINLLILATLMSCGKKNTSGKSNDLYPYLNPYSSPYGAGTTLIGAGQVHPAVASLVSMYPCLNGYGGMTLPPGYPQQPYANQRIPIQVPLTNSPFVVSPGDVHIGVTSYGDVAVVVGTGAGQPPVFYGYMCPRSFTSTGSGQLYDVVVATASQRCPTIKPIVRATVVFPGGATALFRSMDGGMYTYGQPFPGCY